MINDQDETESFYVNLVTINACFEKFVSRSKMFLIADFDSEVYEMEARHI